MDKNEVINQIKKRIDTENVHSIFLVGSFLYKNKFDSVNDLDLVIILDDLNKKSYQKVLSDFSLTCKNISKGKFKFLVETKIGPLKPRRIDGKKIIQLHLLIYDKKSWSKKKWKTSLYDWSNFNKNIFGKKIERSRIFSREDLLFDLNNNLRIVKDSNSLVGTFSSRNGLMKVEYKNKRLNKSEKLDNIYYSAIVSFLNYIRLKKPKQKNKPNELLNLARKFKLVWPW